MVCDLGVFVNEQIMLLQISPALMYRYDNAFWAGGFLHLKPQSIRQNEKFTCYHTHMLECQICLSQMFSLSLWCIFNRSAVFCLFIISNSQPGFIVCEGLFGRWKSFFPELCSGVYVKTSNALQLFYFHHTVEFISIFIMCSLFICRILRRLYDDNSCSVSVLLLAL